MRNEDSTEYHILDYKFIKEPLERKSYNRFTRKYKMMRWPFSVTDTQTTSHSLEIRQVFLMGAVGRKVKKQTT
jgi:hypothetical protein